MKLLYLILLVKLIVAEDGNSTINSKIFKRETIRFPAEWETHLRTFMVWPQSEEIWSEELLPGVRKDIAAIANAIVSFEPVVMLADPTQVAMAQSMMDSRVTVVGMPVDDLWARDTLPVFVLKTRSGLAFGRETLEGVIFNFNGWGNKQIHTNDALVAKRVVEMYNISSVTAQIVAEGGSFETDGKGTLLVTKSSLVNTNRNTKSQDQIEMELKKDLGVKKVIWFDGVKGQDITDAHVDCLVRFVRPGVVVINRPFPGSAPDVWSISSDQALIVLNSSTDVDGNRFQVIDLVEPDPDVIITTGNLKTFLSSYVNFLIGNGFVIIPAFGDPGADMKAVTTIQGLFPGRQVLSVLITTLASGGGGIHCATHDEPKVKENLFWNFGN